MVSNVVTAFTHITWPSEPVFMNTQTLCQADALGGISTVSNSVVHAFILYFLYMFCAVHNVILIDATFFLLRIYKHKNKCPLLPYYSSVTQRKLYTVAFESPVCWSCSKWADECCWVLNSGLQYPHVCMNSRFIASN